MLSLLLSLLPCEWPCQARSKEAGSEAQTGPADGDSLEDEEEADNVVPVSLSGHSKALTSADHIRRAEEMQPVMERWIQALFANKGSEVSRCTVLVHRRSLALCVR